MSMQVWIDVYTDIHRHPYPSLFPTGIGAIIVGFPGIQDAAAPQTVKNPHNDPSVRTLVCACTPVCTLQVRCLLLCGCSLGDILVIIIGDILSNDTLFITTRRRIIHHNQTTYYSSRPDDIISITTRRHIIYHDQTIYYLSRPDNILAHRHWAAGPSTVPCAFRSAVHSMLER